MADIVNAGIVGRVCVRFKDDDPAEAAALAKFKRAGARHDREHNLWHVAAHNKAAALQACIETGGDPSGSVPLTTYVPAPVGGVALKSGWTLTGADAAHIWFTNPFAEQADKCVTWAQMAEAVAQTEGDHRAAVTELLDTARDLLSLSGKRRCPKCDGKGFLMSLRSGPVPCPVCE